MSMLMAAIAKWRNGSICGRLDLHPQPLRQIAEFEGIFN